MVKVAHCDIYADPPIQKEFQGPYDVVIDSFCLICACYTKEKLMIGLSKLFGLLKVGGTFMMCAIEMRTVLTSEYTAGSGKFSCHRRVPGNGTQGTGISRYKCTTMHC